MSNETNLKKSQTVMQSVQSTEKAEFVTIFGSNVNPKWFEVLMKHTGTYLFSLALLLSVVKLGILVYQFIKSPNKNLNKSSSLGWHALHTGMIATAITGTLVAASVFALITPILFVSAMALDTLRNIGLFFWNIGKLASLRFSLKKALKDAADPLTQIKYAKLKEKYLANIKEHALGAVIGLFVTAAAAVIFLFPHIGLGAIGTISLVSFAGFKLTVAGFVGSAAATALTAPFIPLLKNQVSRLISYLKHTFSHKKSLDLVTDSVIAFEGKEEQPHVQATAQKKDGYNNRNFKISSEPELENALQHEINFSAFSLHSRFRETIIDHIDNEALATTALQKMVDEKIKILTAELQKGKTGGYGYFANQQRPRREQKLHALLLIKQQLDPQQDVFKGYEKVFKKFNQIYTEGFDDIEKLITFIESLPGVKESFFLEQSDTQNIIEALKVYAQKFPSQEPVNDFQLAS